MHFWKHSKKRNHFPAWIWGVFAGIGFFGLGAAGGQFAVVWRKAVMLCMECIGIG